MRSRLEVLAGLRVHLLVTTQPVSALLTFLCVEAGLALVAGVEEEEARGLCHAAGICISSSAGQLQASGTCHDLQAPPLAWSTLGASPGCLTQRSVTLVFQDMLRCSQRALARQLAATDWSSAGQSQGC